MATFNSVTDPVAAPVKQTASNNYLDFATGWAQQYLPELYEAEVERYGNRMLSGFLSQVGAEEAMASDKVVWSEQGRLHISIDDVDFASGSDKVNSILDFQTEANADLIRVNDMVLLYCKTSSTAANKGKITKGICTVATAGSTKRTIVPYLAATYNVGVADHNDDATFTAMVYGSEHKKGASLTRTALNPSFQTFSNKPIIIRDRFIINGSDAAQIGWVEVSGEEGQSGYLWYLKAEGDTRARFNDYLEMSMVESERATGTQLDTFLGTGGSGEAEAGTEGLFAAINARGNVCTDATTGTYATDLATFDSIIAKFDAQGAIEENMLYLDRASALNIDDMLGALNRGDNSSASFGVFNNSADMAVNLGFNGFMRRFYAFYKTDWKYLNDKQTVGGVYADLDTAGAVAGVVVPAGTSSVYDEGMGKNIKRPFLHVRYRRSDTEDRKLKTWITGSVGGNITSDEDAMIVNYLSERCLVVQAANNFMLLKK